MGETAFRLHAKWIALVAVFLIVITILNQIWPPTIETFLSDSHNSHIFLGKNPKHMQLAYHLCNHDENNKDNGYCGFYKDYFGKTQQSFQDTAKQLCSEKKDLCLGTNFDERNHKHLSSMYNFCSKIHQKDKEASPALQNKCFGYLKNADLLMKWYGRTIQNGCQDDPETCFAYGIQ
jgi:hypothetical protein